MKLVKSFVKCGICKRDLSVAGFDRHLERHYEPTSRLCNFWYKEYFAKMKELRHVFYVMKKFIQS